jgi:hypothetical protein
MPKMRMNDDGREFDATDEEARDLQARGVAHSAEAADAQAKAAAEGNFSNVTGRPNGDVPETPKPINAAGTPDADQDDDEGAQAEPVKTPSQSQQRRR